MKKDYYIDVPIWPYADEKEREIVDDVLGNQDMVEKYLVRK